MESKEEKIVQVLRKFSNDTLNKIEIFEYDKKFLRKLQERGYKEGKLIVTYLILGLNDYQLKGDANNYWSVLEKLLIESRLPENLQELIGILKPFYEKERLGNTKVRRLENFLNSPIAKDLWTKNFEEILIIGIKNIWNEIANVMNQKEWNKTIAFSMKCLAISLLANGYNNFEFPPIIPADIHIKRVTIKMGLIKENDSDKKIVNIWKKILIKINEVNERFKAYHLDQFFWEIYTFVEDDDFESLRKTLLNDYLFTPELADEFLDLFSQN